MIDTENMTRFEVIFDAEGTNRSKFRNDVKVHLRGPYAVSYDLPTDEGGIHGGDGTAPYPLADRRVLRQNTLSLAGAAAKQSALRE